MAINYEKELNKEQYEAVTTTEGPLLILAGAGTGKTRTIVYRTAYILEHKASANEILMLTFTNKAATEMKDRVSELLGEEKAKEITACTFHSFCVKMLRKYAKYVDIVPHFTILASGDDTDIINMKKAEAKEHRYDKTGFPPSAKIVDIISRAINKNITLKEVLEEEKYVKYAEFLDDIIELDQATSKYKVDNSMLNYDDMLLKMNELLDKRPDIAKEISDTFTYIMVDEYQDTNVLQDRILHSIRKDNKNLAVVGDDMQSLYAFRGAEVQNIIDFPKRMEGTKIVTLVQNYRSNQEILDLSNYAVTFATEGYQKKLVGTHKAGKKPIIHFSSTQSEEAEKVIDLIEELHDDNSVPYDQICVLARNSFITAEVEGLLKMNGINFSKFGGAKFFDLEYVKTVLSYFRIMARTEDEIAWFRVLKLYAGIGDRTAKKIAENCKNIGMEHLKDKKYLHKPYTDGLIELYDEFIKLQDMNLMDVTKEIIEFYTRVNEEYIKKMRVADEAKRTEYLEENKDHYKNLQVLLTIVEKFNTITEFLDDFLLDNTNITQNNNDEGLLVVSTIHSIKGLEFSAVIIMDCIDEIFPSTTDRDIGNKEDNEELRCFYVALTRAKEYLHLMTVNYARVFGRQINGHLSHYLNGAENLYIKEK